MSKRVITGWFQSLFGKWLKNVRKNENNAQAQNFLECAFAWAENTIIGKIPDYETRLLSKKSRMFLTKISAYANSYALTFYT